MKKSRCALPISLIFALLSAIQVFAAEKGNGIFLPVDELDAEIIGQSIDPLLQRFTDAASRWRIVTIDPTKLPKGERSQRLAELNLFDDVRVKIRWPERGSSNALGRIENAAGVDDLPDVTHYAIEVLSGLSVFQRDIHAHAIVRGARIKITRIDQGRFLYKVIPIDNEEQAGITGTAHVIMELDRSAPVAQDVLRQQDPPPLTAAEKEAFKRMEDLLADPERVYSIVRDEAIKQGMQGERLKTLLMNERKRLGLNEEGKLQ